MRRLMIVVRGILHIPIEGSILLLLAGATLHLFATTAMGTFLATPTTHFVELGKLFSLARFRRTISQMA